MDQRQPHDLTHAWQVLHPPVQASAQGWLEVGEGHQLYWEQSGHPGAAAALFVHGGPGAACTSEDRRWFSPQHWRTVLIDQRGCGRSRAADLLHANTTANLVADMEALRQHLGLEHWLLFGGSWGSTLALAYAQAHPQRVLGLVLRGVFLGTRAESHWLYGGSSAAAGAALRHPHAWQRLRQAVGCAPGQPLLDAAHSCLLANDEAALTAAQAWAAWESELMDAELAPVASAPATGAGTDAGPAPGTGTAPAPVRAPVAATADDSLAAPALTLPLQAHRSQALRAARIGVHYARASWFLAEGQLLAQAHRLAGVSGTIVQGQRDLITPPKAARALQAAWPAARLHAVPGAGHASTHPAMAHELINATESLARPGLPAHALA
jgi:proline iminopeptidase